MFISKMFLSPSVINFIYHDQHIISQPLDVRLLDMSLAKILQNGDLPKIQVVEKDGHWFALNNSQLELCRRLEAQGTCTRVKVDVVPLSEVPVQLRNMMVVPQQGEAKTPLTKSCSLPSSSPSSSSTISESKSSYSAPLPCTKQQQSNYQTHSAITCSGSSTGSRSLLCQQPIQDMNNITARESLGVEGSLKGHAVGVSCSSSCSTAVSLKGNDPSRSTGKGYQKLGQGEDCKVEEEDLEEDEEEDGDDELGDDDEEDDDEDDSQETDSSEESDYDSDSECDWSDEDGDSSDCASGSEVEEGTTDDERECLI